MTTIPSAKINIGPAEVAQPRPTIQSVVEQTASATAAASSAQTVAGVEAIVKKHVAPKGRRSGWKSPQTWMAFGALAVSGTAIVKAKDAAVQQAALFAGSATAANHSYQSRKLKTTDPTKPAPPRNFALLKIGGGNTEAKS